MKLSTFNTNLFRAFFAASVDAPEAPATDTSGSATAPSEAKPTKKAAPKKAAPKKTATKKAPAKKAPATKKAAGKKAPVKKGAAKAATTSSGVRPLGKTQLKVLDYLNKKGEKTRAQIGESLGITSGFCSLLGHADPAKVEAGSLLGKGFIKAATYPDPKTEAEGPIHYQITPAGKKALEEAKA